MAVCPSLLILCPVKLICLLLAARWMIYKSGARCFLSKAVYVLTPDNTANCIAASCWIWFDCLHEVHLIQWHSNTVHNHSLLISRQAKVLCERESRSLLVTGQFWSCIEIRFLHEREWHKSLLQNSGIIWEIWHSINIRCHTWWPSLWHIGTSAHQLQEWGWQWIYKAALSKRGFAKRKSLTILVARALFSAVDLVHQLSSRAAFSFG